MSDEKLVWAELDMGSLPAEMQKEIESIQNDETALSGRRERIAERIEKRFRETKKLDPQHDLIVSFRFKKVSVAKKAKATKKARNALAW